MKCNLVLSSLRSSTKGDWYLKSGSSRHMIGEQNYLSDLKPINAEKVTFGDSTVGRIFRKGKLNFQGLLALDDVMLVEGLTANLISINQLCDQGINVSFTKKQRIVTNDVKALVMTGTRSSNNYYLWNSINESSVCHLLDKTKLVYGTNVLFM